MRKFTRTLSCALIAALLLTAAATAAACGKRAEYPTVSEVTEPQTVGEVIPAVDRQEQLAAAKRANPDTAAWLYMPGAEVDDAVMQAADNGYYLQKDENGNFSEWGCYYAHCDDHLSSRSALDKNTVIFGHSATNCDPDGPKFTKLHRYMDADFVQENPYIYLSVEGDDMVFQITACFITDISFDYISPDLAGEELTGLLRQVEEKNWLAFDGVTFGEEDTILTLSTCCRKYDMENTGDQRLVVMAKLLPEGAAAQDFTVPPSRRCPEKGAAGNRKRQAPKGCLPFVLCAGKSSKEKGYMQQGAAPFACPKAGRSPLPQRHRTAAHPEAAAAYSETDIYFSLCSIRHRVERLTPSWTAA